MKELGLPWWLSGKESACNAGDLGQEDPLEEEMATYSSILAWKTPIHRVTKKSYVTG